METQSRWVRSIASQVRRLRTERGMSAKQLAERCAELGVPDLERNVIANLENGRRRAVSVDELLALAVALDTSPVVLMFDFGVHDPAAVTPTVEAHPHLVWKWFRGEDPLPGTDVRRWQPTVQLVWAFDALEEAQKRAHEAHTGVHRARFEGADDRHAAKAYGDALHELAEARERIRQLGGEPPELGPMMRDDMRELGLEE